MKQKDSGEGAGFRIKAAGDHDIFLNGDKAVLAVGRRRSKVRTRIENEPQNLWSIHKREVHAYIIKAESLSTKSPSDPIIKEDLGILEEIVATTHRRVEEKKGKFPLTQIEARVKRSDRSFKSALKGKRTGIIAEMKRASPSRGIMRPSLNVEKWAQAYQKGGACAISVLTEPSFFKGSLDDLRRAREASHLPVLLKDFVIDPYQVYEARFWGADSILLITSILGVDDLSSLLSLSEALGMTPLVEVHTEKEIERAIKSGAEIVGVNNRNLADFTVSLSATFRLLPFIPKDKLTVSESGIEFRSQVVELEKAGINACLVGEALMRSEDPGSKLQELLGAQG